MPTGYLVSLGDSSLDSGDSVSTSVFSFTTASTLGSGSITMNGEISHHYYVRDYNLNGDYYQGTDGNVYFVPDYMPRRVSSAEVNNHPTYSNADGIVEGTGGDDLIDGAYLDADGDQIDSGSGTGPAGNGDVVEAGDGNDTVLAGDGDDTVSGGGGDDLILGGDGDDVLRGDGVTNASPTSESLNWSAAGSDEEDISDGFTQTTGVMDVNVSFSDDGRSTGISVETSSQTYVGSGESFDDNSSLELRGTGQGNTSTTTISFDSNQPEAYADNVQNVSFRLTDVDGLRDGWQDIVKITAVDANGDPVAITINGNSDDVINGDTIYASLTRNSYSDENGSVLVTVSGPVHSISIDYDNGFSNGQVLVVSDVHFETIPVQAGDDTIDGGTGDDLIYGEAGDDSLRGGEGSDTIDGGSGDDTLAGGAGGDRLGGGAGMDYLDYTASDAGVSINLGTNAASGGHAEGDTLAGGLDGIYGSDWDDTLTGYDGQGADWTNVFYGNGGDDYLDGAGGDDSLYGGTGADTIYGGDGADLLEGDEGADVLDGGAGADTMSGGAGADVLTVGSGDIASGDEGDDLFIVQGGGGTISVDGGEGDEGAGDSIDFQGKIDWNSINYTNSDPGDLAGSVTLDDGTVVSFSHIENVIICFKAGTRIQTPHGPCAIETLQPGDLVITRDNGVQPVRWAGSRRVPGKGEFAPVRFAPGTVGNSRALIVSPQHRMLHRSTSATLLFNTPEVLIAARHLVNGRSIRMIEKDEIEYVHILFDRHEIIFAEGAPSESFHPGRQGLNGVMGAAREELFNLFPELRSDPDSFGDTARPCLREFEARLLQPT